MVKKRAKVCFSCKLYIIIHSNNPINMEFENVFNVIHSGHMIQIVNLDEVESEDYICIPEVEIWKLVKEAKNGLLYIDMVAYSW